MMDDIDGTSWELKSKMTPKFDVIFKKYKKKIEYKMAYV